MSRYISLITLLLVIGILIVVFYKVMAVFFVPLFLAALLVVIFKPFHLWFLNTFKGQQKLAAFLTTATILLVVLIPLLALFVLAAFESQQLLRKINKESLITNVESTRRRLNLELPPVTDELLQVENGLANMGQIQQLEEVSYLDTGKLANTALYNDDIGMLVNQDFSDSKVVLDSWNAYLEEFSKLEDLQHEIAEPLQADEEDDLQESEPESPSKLLHRFHQQVEIAQDDFAKFKLQLLGGNPFKIWLKELANPDRDTQERYGNTAIDYARSFLVDIGTLTTSFLGRLLLGGSIMIISLYFFLLDGPAMIDALKQLSPIDDTHEQELILEFSRVSRAVVVATLLAALVQGLLGGIGYYFAGLDSVFLLTLLTGCLALVPFVGAAAVWVPCSLWLFFIENDMTSAIGLAVYGLLVISLSDNLIKPLVLHGQSNIHPLFALLSVLGGVTALGPIGILIGPMVVAFLQTLLEILQREMKSMDRAATHRVKSDPSDFVISTNRIGLRKFRSSDLDAMSSINADPQVMEHFPSTYDRQQTQDFIHRVNGKIDENGFSMWAAELISTGELLGFVGISKVPFESDFTPAVEIGWRMAKKHWGHGYATEAANGCLKFAFEQACLEEVVSFTALPNKRSEKVMQRIGMTKVGEFDHPKIEDGDRLKKHVLYKITKSQWQDNLNNGELNNS